MNAAMKLNTFWRQCVINTKSQVVAPGLTVWKRLARLDRATHAMFCFVHPCQRPLRCVQGMVSRWNQLIWWDCQQLADLQSFPVTSFNGKCCGSRQRDKGKIAKENHWNTLILILLVLGKLQLTTDRLQLTPSSSLFFHCIKKLA